MIKMIETIEMIMTIIKMIKFVVVPVFKKEAIKLIQRSMINKNRCQLLLSKNIICRIISLMIKAMMMMIIMIVIIAKEKKILKMIFWGK